MKRGKYTEQNLCYICQNSKRDISKGIVCGIDSNQYDKTRCLSFIETETSKRLKEDAEKRSQKRRKDIRIILVMIASIAIATIAFKIHINKNAKDHHTKYANILAQKILTLPDSTLFKEMHYFVSILDLKFPDGNTRWKFARGNTVGKENLIAIFKQYKQKDSRLTLKKFYIDDDNIGHLLFLGTSSASFGPSIIELKTKEYDGLIIIFDMLSYQEGSWISSIESAYLTVKNKELGTLLERSMQAQSSGDKEAAIKYLTLLDQKYGGLLSSRDTYLQLYELKSISEGAHIIAEKIDQELKKSGSDYFKLIWNYRRAFYTKDILQLRHYASMMKKIVGDDLSFECDELYVKGATGDRPAQSIQKIERIIKRNPNIAYPYLIYWKLCNDTNNPQKANELSHVITSLFS